MDSLHEQMNTLNSKVDALHQLVEQLNLRFTEAFSDQAPTSEVGYRSPWGPGLGRRTQQNRSSVDIGIEHKDVLSDVGFLDNDSHSGEHTLTPEVQLQRLTAQLTAAYNRIAALEEQLLAQRIH